MSHTSQNQQKAQPVVAKPKWKDLGPRLASAFFMLAITILMVWLGGIWFALMVAAVFAWVMREWEKMITMAPLSTFGYVLMTLVAIIPIVTVSYGAAAGAIAALFGLVVAFFGASTGRYWRIGGFAFFALVIVAIMVIRGANVWGFFACIFLGTTVWMTDTGAFFSGRFFGGAKLSPEISPAKTWSGAIGGLFAGSVAGLVIWIVSTPSPWWIGLVIAIAVSISGQLGDLTESAIKRHFQVKDTGGAIPGHGGLLDRLDSLTFGALLVFLIGAFHADPFTVANGLMLW